MNVRVYSPPRTEFSFHEADFRMDPTAAKIFEAADNDDLETVKMLIESGGVLPSITRPYDNSYPGPGDTLAQVATRRGNLGMLKYLTEKDSSLLKTISEDLLGVLDDPILSLLEEAVTRGYLDIVKYLVEVHNDDIFRQRSSWGGRYSAVDLSVYKGHLNIVRYFIEERHVDPNTNRPPNAVYYDSNPLLFGAVGRKHHNITTYLIEDRKVDLTALNKEKENILFTALFQDNLDLIKNVLDVKKAEIDINWRDDEGNTLVNWTVYLGHLHLRKNKPIEYLQYLVGQRKADVNIPGFDEKSPLLEATGRASVEVFKYLVDHGADLEKRDKYGRTPLHLAADNEGSGSEFCRHLLEHGANVKSKNNKGETPLHIAIAKKNLKACKCLIDFSGNVNEKNEDGETLLHFVAARGQIDLVVYLVNEKHAQINLVREKDHWTSLHCAALWGHREICEYLIKHGADPRAKDKMGESPAQVASDKALIEYIEKAAEIRSRRSVDHSFWIPAQPSAPNSRTHRLTAGQHVGETVWASEVNAFHIDGAFALTNFIIRYLFPSSVYTRRIGNNDELATNMENLPNRDVHIAEDAVHAFLDFEEEETT